MGNDRTEERKAQRHRKQEKEHGRFLDFARRSTDSYLAEMLGQLEERVESCRQKLVDLPFGPGHARERAIALADLAWLSGRVETIRTVFEERRATPSILRAEHFVEVASAVLSSVQIEQIWQIVEHRQRAREGDQLST